MKLRTLAGLACLLGAGAVAFNMTRVAERLTGLPVPPEFRSAGWVFAALLLAGLVLLTSDGRGKR